jgi:hypothetical protein
MTDVEHTPLRPSWLCAADGEPWPCDAARQAMAGEDSISRAIFMALMLHEATGDMPDATPSELYERFVAWTRTTPADEIERQAHSLRPPVASHAALL